MEEKNSKKTNLSSQFAIMTSLLIGIIILVTAGYMVLFTKDLNNQISYQNSNFNKSLATMIFELIRKDLVANDYEKITDKVR